MPDTPPATLTLTSSISRHPSKRPHQVVKGDNLPVLHRLGEDGVKVDVLLTDPPYNVLGASNRYNDDFGSHADWVASMRPRLVAAHQLLEDTGVALVHIDDREHAYLRLLMDEVFGERNFITNIVWADKGSNLSRFTSGGTDYMLAYAKNITMAPGWRDVKEHAPEVIAIGRKVTTGELTPGEATTMVRGYLTENRDDLPKGVNSYRDVDELGRVYCTSNMNNALYRPNLRYPIANPVTGTVHEPPANGWRAQESTMAQWLDEGRVVFTKNGPRKKIFLHETADVVPNPVFASPRLGAARHLEQMLGDKRFPYPKDVNVLARWIRMVAAPDAVVLDMFAGSGSTGEAVMRLNAEDGGTRQAILITNNEVSAGEAARLSAAGVEPGTDEWEAMGVYEHVTRPRIATVVTGVREDGSRWSDGLEENVNFYESHWPIAGRRIPTQAPSEGQ